MSGQELVYDGMAELDEIQVPVVARPCPACGAPCSFDPVAVARSGIPIGWATSPEIALLQDHALASLPLAVGDFDGKRTLRSARHPPCSPSVAPVDCSSCATRCLAVVSFGEVQPVRWWLVVEGLVPGPPK